MISRARSATGNYEGLVESRLSVGATAWTALRNWLPVGTGRYTNSSLDPS